MEYLMKKLNWAVNAETGELFACVWNKNNTQLKILNYPEMYDEFTISLKSDDYDYVTKTLAPYLHLDNAESVAFVRLFNMVEMLNVEGRKVQKLMDKFTLHYDDATIKDYEIEYLNKIFEKKIEDVCEQRKLKMKAEELVKA